MHSQVGDADGRDAQSTQRKFIASLLESLGADMDMMEGLARVEAAAEAGGGGNEVGGKGGGWRGSSWMAPPTLCAHVLTPADTS